jgi:ATP-dependent Lhr-like helicase
MTARSALDVFHPSVRDWFAEAFAAPTRAQALGWAEIAAGRSTLILAPTGSGKTLAAFLSAIERVMYTTVPAKAARCRVLYVSPLRALAVDVERNLRAPLSGIARMAARRGEAVHLPDVAIRTGDTPAAERAKIARTPPDILITTPESLFLILTSQARALLGGVEVVIVDEIHALVGTKRGVHLALSLERVEELAQRELQRIGLSATQRPLDAVARYLGGTSARAGTPRPVSIVDAGARKAFDIRVEVPVEDMARMGEPLMPLPIGNAKGPRGEDRYTPSSRSEDSQQTDDRQRPEGVYRRFVREIGPTSMRAAAWPLAAADDFIPEGPAASPERRSIWPSIHPRLVELIRAHRSTILFTNSRRLAERLAASLNELAGQELVRAHHGSLAREQRLVIEDALKAGRLPGIVATSSLELGIDMGAVDLVVQIETPPSVASGMQRIGRASHQAEAVSKGVIFPKYRGDLLATAAITRAMREGNVEETRMPKNALDVLAQQLVSMCIAGERRVDELYTLVRRAAPFAELPRQLFEGVLDMLSGRYPSDEFAELRPRLVWDRLRGFVRAREGARALVVANAGTIPDKGLFGVYLADDAPHAPGTPRKPGRRVGELDEEMVFESFAGDVIVLGASSWRVLEITRDRVLVAPAPGEPGRLPFWKADRPPRPVELGRAIGRLTRELLGSPRERAEARLQEQHSLDARAAKNLLAYLEDQKQATGVLPDDRTLVLERTRDELGDWRLILLSPFGGRVHAAWALLIEARLERQGLGEAETIWSDDGIVIRVGDRETPPDAAALVCDPEEAQTLLLGRLPGTTLFAAHFREAAGRALLLPRRRPGQRTPLWMQRKRAHDLLQVAARYPSFPIVLEAMRECLQDVFDVPALVELFGKLRARELRLATVDTQAPSPFAASLLFGYVANYLYDGDAPLAERRAQALAVDQRQLRELLGEAELRELIDRQALADVEASLQGKEPRQRARSVDRVHDLLLRVGELTPDEVAARIDPPAETAGLPGEPRGQAEHWLEALVAERRAFALTLAGERRYAAAEDAGRLRDALGVQPPPGLPQAFLEPVPAAFQQLLARYARTHGPFTSSDVARRYGTSEIEAQQALLALGSAGRLLEGEFRPGGHGREWCDPQVLAQLRRRSLAKLRKQVEPAEASALARLLLDWQGVDLGRAANPRGGPEALLEVVEQLQGAAVPASALETDVLPSRLAGYRPEDLDALCAAGEVVWVGLAPLGERDGRVALFLAEDLPLLFRPAGDPVRGEVHDKIRAVLAERGASFWSEIHTAVGGMQRPLLDALWDLVWSGEITNDAPGALRAFLGGRAPRRLQPRRRLASFRSRRDAPPSAVGRFSLLAPRREAAPPNETRRLTAVAEQLLARHGVLTRDAVAAEGVGGGFAALYPVLTAMEEAGRVRRGYFVAGLGGSQFADAGAVDRLRALRDTSATPEEEDAASVPAVVLAATDPANPYGAALPWPRLEGAPFMRAVGAHVVLVDGRLAAFVTRGESAVSVLLPAEEPQRTAVAHSVARALARFMLRTGRAALAWGADTEPLAKSPLAPFLADAGFVTSGPGFRLVAKPPDQQPLGGAAQKLGR